MCESHKTLREVAAWAERDQYLEQNVKLKAEIERLRAYEWGWSRLSKGLRDFIATEAPKSMRAALMTQLTSHPTVAASLEPHQDTQTVPDPVPRKD